MENEKITDTLHLEWVPTWEGALKYCPDDLRQDKPLRFWRVRRLKSGKKVIYQLKAGLRSSNHFKQRYQLTVRVKGKKTTIYLSYLTMLCITGFAIADRHHWVIDHINNNSTDDRPSNLQVIHQSENLRRSALFNENQKLINEERVRRKRIRQQWLEEMRPKVIATIGEGATKEDVELELALLYHEHKFKY
jgi:hypothetical protein